MADNETDTENNEPETTETKGKNAPRTKFDRLRQQVKKDDGETYVRALVTRVVKRGKDEEPLVYVQPLEPDVVRELELEGHRQSTGEILITHERPGGAPNQFDAKRVAVDGDLIAGAEIGLVHLDKRRR